MGVKYICRMQTGFKGLTPLFVVQVRGKQEKEIRACQNGLRDKMVEASRKIAAGKPVDEREISLVVAQSGALAISSIKPVVQTSLRPCIATTLMMVSGGEPQVVRPNIAKYKREIRELLDQADELNRTINRDPDRCEELILRESKWVGDEDGIDPLLECFNGVLRRMREESFSDEEYTQMLIEVFNFLAQKEKSFPPYGFMFSEEITYALAEVPGADPALLDQALLALWMDNPLGAAGGKPKILDSMWEYEPFRKLFEQRIAEVRSEDPGVVEQAKAWFKALYIDKRDIQKKTGIKIDL